MTLRTLDRRDLALGLGLAAGYVALLLATAGSQGYARDEGFYFAAAESYAAWFRQLVSEPSAALSRAGVDAAWAVNHEHPALVKSLFSLSWIVLHQKMHLFAQEGTAFRFPGMCFGGLAVLVTYLFTTEVRGRLAGLVAATLFAFVPTTFYHAHLDCFDVPIAAMWLLSAWTYFRSVVAPSPRAFVVFGVVYGLTLDTKHNAWFLPFFVAAHWALAHGRAWLAKSAAPRPKPWALVSMLTVGPLVFVALWPWLWRDTTKRFVEYAKFHLHHDYYNMEFLGVTYWQPPFPRAYAWLMTLGTVPFVTLALFGVGVVVALRAEIVPLVRGLVRPRGALGATVLPGAPLALFVLGVATNYAPWLSRSTPIFGGTKHWLGATTFLAMLAGIGFSWAVDIVRARFPGRQLLGPSLAALVAVPSIVMSLRAHPWGLSAYTAIVGGTPGAATLGLNRGFWGYTTGSVTDVLDARVPPNGAVYVHDTAWDAWRMLQRDGRLRRDLRAVGSPAGADAALYHHEQHMAGVEYQIWVAMGTVSPVVVRGLDGVPIVWVYLRPR